ncbi:MAG: GNAT family N-acetyltransferase [Turicibacter sp.]|nr:GNAT family N-acetyltransferase [Turicibacter sp.]
MLLKNSKQMIIRKAQKEDAQAIIDYCNVVGGESDNLTFGENEFGMTLEQEEQFIEETRDSKTSGLFIALIEGEVASVLNLSCPTKERIAHTSEIGISVKQKFWGLGIATMMLERVIAFASASEQIEIIGLTVRADNIAALGLYKKMGFVEIGRYPKAIKIGREYYDEVLMNLYL